jgi:hypothetical protein
MRVLALVSIAFLSFPLTATASPQVSAEDAEIMRIEALADRAPERIQGFTPYIHDQDATADPTTGRNMPDPDDCSRVPVLTKRGDGKVVRQLIDMCD